MPIQLPETVPAAKRRHGINYVTQRYNVDRVTVHRWIKKGAFPQPDSINGMNSWTEERLDAFDEELARKRAEKYEDVA